MPAGKHTSVRVALAVPPKLHEQLSAWADWEGRPLASLCLYLIETQLRDAQKQGIAPKYGDNVPDEEDDVPEVDISTVMTRSSVNNPKVKFTEHYENMIAEKALKEKTEKEDKKEKIMAALAAIIES